MIKAVLSFFEENITSKAPLLLALSGGPDSLALFYLLLLYRRQKGHLFAVAHLDHCWREESGREASLLEILAKVFAVPFHTGRLDPKACKGNLEEAARFSRLEFFNQLCQQKGYQAVIMGHHADDQAETVLKQIAESGRLTSIKGMQPIAILAALKVWRPLLAYRKKEIQHLLEKWELKGFCDKSNEDPRFLRARLRHKLLPYCNELFGKKMELSLCHLAQEADELNAYLEQKVAPYFNRIVKGKMGQLLDLSVSCPSAFFELKYLILKFCKEGGMPLSRRCIDAVIQIIYRCEGGKKWCGKGNVLHLDRRRLFITKESSFFSTPKLSLKEGTHSFGPWLLDVRCCKEQKGEYYSGWKEVFKGELELVLPEGNYTLSLASSKDTYWQRSTISRFWSEQKVPLFLRGRTPVLYNKGVIIHEFLTGRRKKVDIDESSFRVKLKWKGLERE